MHARNLHGLVSLAQCFVSVITLFRNYGDEMDG